MYCYALVSSYLLRGSLYIKFALSKMLPGYTALIV